MSKEDPKKRSQWQPLEFTYIADELGHIVETRPAFQGNGALTSTLGPFSKPRRPDTIDTAEKQAMWDSYWDNIGSWWTAERENEKRSKWL